MLRLSKKDKILIVRLTALGDCIHTLPIVSAIKAQFPDVFIGWAVSEKCKDVILNNPLIDKVHLIPKNDKINYMKTIKNIRDEHYTIAIDSQELLKSGIISFLSGAKYRLAHAKSREFSSAFANCKLPAVPIFDCTRHVVERNMDFVRYLGIDNPSVDFVLPENNFGDVECVNDLLKDIDINKKNLVISPSTTWITKFWTKENWACIVREFGDKLNVIITGSPADCDYVKDILKLANNTNVVNLVGKTNILQLKIVFENADIVITPDSGSAHLAAAVCKPKVIALFGATSEVRNAAYGSSNFNLVSDLACQPCYKKLCKFQKGIPPCMKNITPDVVIDKVNSILNNE